MLKRADLLTGQGEPLRVMLHTGQHSVGETKIVSTLYIPSTIGQIGPSTYILILIAILVRRWKQTGSNSLLQDFGVICAHTEIKKLPYLGHNHGPQGQCILLRCSYLYIKIDASSITQNSCQCHVHLFSAAT